MIQLKNSPHHQRILTLLGNVTMHYEEMIDILVQHQIMLWIGQVSQQVRTIEIEIDLQNIDHF